LTEIIRAIYQIFILTAFKHLQISNNKKFMALTLHTIKPAKGSVKKRKRVGRGNSSGHGTYSTRGLKGQKSRSGASGLTRLGLKQMLRATPKVRGFKSLKPKNQVVNLSVISSAYKEGEIVSRKSLFRKGIIDNSKVAVKVLSTGKLSVKKLVIEDILMSKSAMEKLKAMECIIK
jgi:large subunit ribosomal protein L15